MNRRAFATLSAVILMSVAAAAMTAGVAVLASQWRRSQAQQVETQLRQDLVAGEVYARAAMARGETDAEASLPGGGTLRATETAPLQWTVAAERDGRRASQVLIYERAGEPLVLRGAELW